MQRTETTRLLANKGFPLSSNLVRTTERIEVRGVEEGKGVKR